MSTPTPDPNQNPAAQIAASQQPTQADPTAAPATPAVTPTAQPNPSSPYAGVRPLTAPADQPHPITGTFDKLLRYINSGTSYVDENGQTRTNTSRSTLGNSILAAALAGLATPTRYREGAYGPVVSGDATAAGAFQAGRGQQTAQNDAAQKAIDDAQTKKLSVIKNNVDMMHQYAALAMQEHKDLADIADRNNATILKDLGDYDQTTTDPSQRLILGKGLTMAQALDKLKGKMTSQNAVIDGYQDVMDPETHQMTVQPTFAVINPDAKINMSESAAAELAKFKPAYKNAYALTDGNIRVPVTAYLSDVHLANTLSSAEAFMQRADSALGVKPDMSLAAAAAKDPRVIQSVKEAENALAQGGSTADVLDRIQKSPNGSVLLDAMGIDQDKATKYITDYRNEQIRQAALAKEGGIGDKAPAPAGTVTALRNNIKALPADDAARLLTDIPKDGNMTMGQVEKLTGRIDQVVKDNKERDLKAGNPDELVKTANRIVFENDPSSLDQILSARQNVRETAANVIHDTAEKAGLDTTMFTPAALKAKADTYKDYSGNKKGSTGSQIASFNAFLGHTAGAVDAEKRLEGKTLGLSRSPWVNTAMDALGKQVTDDPDWKAYKTSLLPVQNEISNFLAAGYAVKAEDAALMQQAVDPHETPARITAALRQLAETADIRLSAIGQRYLDTVGTTYPKLLSTDSANTLKRLGINSRAIPLSTQLPRGWQNNQPQQLTDKNVARVFFQAAGGDKVKAQALAKANGWEL